jgi:hypothetical protein
MTAEPLQAALFTPCGQQVPLDASRLLQLKILPTPRHFGH